MLTPLITIALLHWAVLLIPGFNFLLVGQLAAGGSRRAALAAVVGMTSATLIWATLAVAGVGAVFSAQPVLRQIVQLAGGLYLLTLAWGLFRAAGQPVLAEGRALGSLAAFRAGFVTSALNPKIALFYGSVFATALPHEPAAGQVVAAVLLVYANSWLWHGSLAFLLSRPAVQQAYVAHFRGLTRISAALVGAFGLRLILVACQEARARLG